LDKLGGAEFTVRPNPGAEFAVGFTTPAEEVVLKVGAVNPELLKLKPEVVEVLLRLNKELPELLDGFVVFDTPNAVDGVVVVSPNPKPLGLLLEDNPKPEGVVCPNREVDGVLEVLFNSEKVLLGVVEELVPPKVDPNEELNAGVELLVLFVPKEEPKVGFVVVPLPNPEFEKLNPELLAGVALLGLVPNPLFPEVDWKLNPLPKPLEGAEFAVDPLLPKLNPEEEGVLVLVPNNPVPKLLDEVVVLEPKLNPVPEFCVPEPERDDPKLNPEVFVLEGVDVPKVNPVEGAVVVVAVGVDDPKVNPVEGAVVVVAVGVDDPKVNPVEEVAAGVVDPKVNPVPVDVVLGVVDPKEKPLPGVVVEVVLGVDVPNPNAPLAPVVGAPKENPPLPEGEGLLPKVNPPEAFVAVGAVLGVDVPKLKPLPGVAPAVALGVDVPNPNAPLAPPVLVGAPKENPDVVELEGEGAEPPKLNPVDPVVPLFVEVLPKLNPLDDVVVLGDEPNPKEGVFVAVDPNMLGVDGVPNDRVNPVLLMFE
jgi:hypothetical protein